MPHIETVLAQLGETTTPLAAAQSQLAFKRHRAIAQRLIRRTIGSDTSTARALCNYLDQVYETTLADPDVPIPSHLSILLMCKYALGATLKATLWHMYGQAGSGKPYFTHANDVVRMLRINARVIEYWELVASRFTFTAEREAYETRLKMSLLGRALPKAPKSIGSTQLWYASVLSACIESDVDVFPIWAYELMLGELLTPYGYVHGDARTAEPSIHALVRTENNKLKRMLRRGLSKEEAIKQLREQGHEFPYNLWDEG